MPNEKGPPKRNRLNRDRVLDAGIALADAEGLEVLTMRRLGRELGVEAMALYNHVANKEDLLDGMLDRVAAEIEVSDAGSDWRDQARRRAISAHTALLRHPWAAWLWTGSIKLGPARMQYLDDALRNLREAGFAPELLDRAFHTIENHIVGHALQALGFPLDRNEMTEIGGRFLEAFPGDRFPDLEAHIRHHLEHQDNGEGFEFGLDLILDGLERLRARS